MILRDDDRAKIMGKMIERQAQSSQPTRISGPIAQFAMDVPPPIDFRPEIKEVAEAIRKAAETDDDTVMASAIDGVANAIKSQSLQPLIAAIAKIRLDVPATDTSAAVSAIVKAIDANTAAVKAMAAAMKADRELVFDEDQRPIGTRTVWVQ